MPPHSARVCLRTELPAIPCAQATSAPADLRPDDGHARPPAAPVCTAAPALSGGATAAVAPATSGDHQTAEAGDARAAEAEAKVLDDKAVVAGNSVAAAEAAPLAGGAGAEAAYGAQCLWLTSADAL